MKQVMKPVTKREYVPLLCLSAVVGLSLLMTGCGSKQSSGTPPTQAERQQQVQEIVNDPHVPQSIKDHLQAQGKQPPPGAQSAPGSGQSATR